MRLPRTWNDITISQFQECYFLLGDKPGTDEWIKVISVLTGKSFDYIESIPLRKLKGLILSLHFLRHPTLNEKVKKYIVLNGRIYKAVYFATELNTAQAIDLKTFLKPDGLDQTGTIVENAHKLLASIYLPLSWIGFKYNGSKHEKIANDFKSTKMGDVYGTLFFYSVVYRNWMLTLEASGRNANLILEPHMKEVIEWATKNKILETDGIGK